MNTKEDSKENCSGWAARDPSGVLSPYQFNRRVPGLDDISLKITHCGVCYADVVWTRNEHGDSKYPLVPGHEIVGIVKEVGINVVRFKVGDHVGVGTYVNSCQQCEYCNERMEVNCAEGSIYTFNGIDVDGTVTKGGYSSHIVVHQRYCFKIPDNLPLASAAPLLCAGITVYSPMIRHHMNHAGKSLGVIGLGGLGHMAVKFGKAFGLNVTVLSTSASKKDEALSILGADKFLLSSDKQKIEASSKTLDFIIDTASGDHPIDLYMPLLKTSGVFVIVGFPSEIKIHPANLIIDIWWRSYGARSPNLQKLAIRILSQTCSSSGCERNWSVFEKIHAKKRNRLEFARLNDLVYVHYNIRLRVRQIESPIDPDAISLDNIDVLSPWRVESEEPILEESPSWLEPVADDPLEQGQQEEDSESEEQQHLEEEQEEQEEEDTVGASASTPSAIDIGEHSSMPTTHYLTLGADAESGPSTTRGRPGKQPLMFSRKRGRGQ